MPNKALRILIADAQHFYRLKIERDLNQLGYYRIAPMHRLAEVLSAVEFGNEPLDLLIINASLAQGTRFDLLWFCMSHPQIRYAMIYDQRELTSASLRACRPYTVMTCASPLPDMETLADLMAAVDFDPVTQVHNKEFGEPRG